MKTLPLDPRKLDVPRFVTIDEAMEGHADCQEMPRLQEALLGPPPQPVVWKAQGQLVPVSGATPRPMLHLQASVTLGLQCQRCLQAVLTPLEVDRRFWFAASEAEAERWDDETDDEVLVLERQLDLWALLEDELLLALPLVPRHEVCPEPLLPVGAPGSTDRVSDAVDGGAEAPPHPFAVLAKLKLPL